MEKVLKFQAPKVLTPAQQKVADWCFMATLGDGSVVRLTACNASVAECTDPERIASMLTKCVAVAENKAGNFTVAFDYGKYVSNTVFVANYEHSEEALLTALHGVTEVFPPLTSEEQIAAW